MATSIFTSSIIRFISIISQVLELNFTIDAWEVTIPIKDMTRNLGMYRDSHVSSTWKNFSLAVAFARDHTAAGEPLRWVRWVLITTVPRVSEAHCMESPLKPWAQSTAPWSATITIQRLTTIKTQSKTGVKVLKDNWFEDQATVRRTTDPMTRKQSRRQLIRRPAISIQLPNDQLRIYSRL